MSAPVTSETSALLALIIPPDGKTTTKATDALYAALGPLHDAIESVKARVADVQKARRAADAAEDADYAFAFFERIKQASESLERWLASAADNLDRACDTAYQLDQYALEMRKSLDTREERLAADEKMAAGRVILSKDEYDHLVARADAGTMAVADANRAAAVPAVPTP